MIGGTVAILRHPKASSPPRGACKRLWHPPVAQTVQEHCSNA